MWWKIYFSHTASFRYPFGRFQGWVLGVCVVSNASRNWGTYLQPSKNPEHKQLWPQNHPSISKCKKKRLTQSSTWLSASHSFYRVINGSYKTCRPPWQNPPGGNRRRWIIVWPVIWDPVLVRLHGVMSQPCFGAYPFVGSWYLANGGSGGGRKKHLQRWIIVTIFINEVMGRAPSPYKSYK